MGKQTIPLLEFGHFAFGDILEMFNKGEIFVNEAYQRTDMWKQKQKVELIKSINERYSIGVLVLFTNDSNKYEILDGQQRLLTIKKYLAGDLELSDSDIKPYDSLSPTEKRALDNYSVYYLELHGFSKDTKEDDVVQTFLRLQEGTPLNKAEKLNAYRGVFKDTFKNTREKHRLFAYLGPEKRFRLRQLAAELLLLEVDGNFSYKLFPGLDTETMIEAVQKYEKRISKNKLRDFKGNLDFMERSLNVLLGAFEYRDVISFYLLISYLRKHKAGKQNLEDEYAEFARLFLQKLNMFSIYDKEPPDGMTLTEFNTYRTYKEESKVMTTSDSFKNRLDIMLDEYKRLHPIIIADKQRLFDINQKRILFFRQKGICPECNKPLEFRSASAHHEIAHAGGGKTNDLKHAQLVHEKCHVRIEKRLKKEKTKE